ncbi:DUF2500 domain-containing protein [Paenibacillus sp. P22]|uniref:DUF2500 domain-containing protein n=1 Tax=Paenibacillus sp. P22 TaxID=483908 RepID=UPI00038FAACD|nr:DUF2500 domain-containing protein [Paenibacillus sp. P22]CDN44265.1 hypothetical protein BN871_EN_00030 [Paenibacillus sp. P22]
MDAGWRPFLFAIVLVLLIGSFVFVLVIGKGVFAWGSDNAAEMITISCKVVDKRTKVSGGSGDFSAGTAYYAAFEFVDGSLVELRMPADEFGLPVAGDVGELTYQGTRYKGFERHMHASGAGS